MTLRNASVFAIIGLTLWVVRLAITLVVSISGLARGIEPAAASLTVLIHFVAILSLLVFFVVYHRAQS